MKKIVSGGQTGADQAGLSAAKALGIDTGGWIPKGFLTENGPDERLADYGLKEHSSPKYPPRTYANVASSDGTIRFAYDFSTPGERCTRKAIAYYKKPYFNVDARNPPPHKEVLIWLRENNINILNVAGNRESTNPGIGKFTFEYLLLVLAEWMIDEASKCAVTTSNVP